MQAQLSNKSPDLLDFDHISGRIYKRIRGALPIDVIGAVNAPMDRARVRWSCIADRVLGISYATADEAGMLVANATQQADGSWAVCMVTPDATVAVFEAWEPRPLCDTLSKVERELLRHGWNEASLCTLRPYRGLMA